MQGLWTGSTPCREVKALILVQEALYDLLRLQSAMEDEHTAELVAREEEIEHLKQLVDSLARRQTSKHEVRACISLGFIHRRLSSQCTLFPHSCCSPEAATVAPGQGCRG